MGQQLPFRRPGLLFHRLQASGSSKMARWAGTTRIKIQQPKLTRSESAVNSLGLNFIYADMSPRPSCGDCLRLHDGPSCDWALLHHYYEIDPRNRSELGLLWPSIRLPGASQKRGASWQPMFEAAALQRNFCTISCRQCMIDNRSRLETQNSGAGPVMEDCATLRDASLPEPAGSAHAEECSHSFPETLSPSLAPRYSPPCLTTANPSSLPSSPTRINSSFLQSAACGPACGPCPRCCRSIAFTHGGPPRAYCPVTWQRFDIWCSMDQHFMWIVNAAIIVGRLCTFVCFNVVRLGLLGAFRAFAKQHKDDSTHRGPSSSILPLLKFAYCALVLLAAYWACPEKYEVLRRCPMVDKSAVRESLRWASVDSPGPSSCLRLSSYLLPASGSTRCDSSSSSHYSSFT
jgi:hypothetical protein